MRPVILLTTVSILAPFTSVIAQEQPPVRPGDRVRVTHECRTTVRQDPLGKTHTRCRKDKGTLAAATADSIVLGVDERGTQLTLPVASVTRLEVSRGRKSRVALGAGIGALTGAATLAVIGANLNVCDGGYEGACAGVGAGVGAVGGALVGLVIGAVTKTDRWEEVPLDQLRVSLAPQRDGQFALGLSFAF